MGQTNKPARNSIAEWATTAILLLFGTTSVLQAFVIPTGSMESTLLVGDHVLVDKLIYSPPGSLSKSVLPYRDVQRGDIIVFRYPVNLKETYVKRAIGLPGDRIRLDHQRLVLNGTPMNEPYIQHIPMREDFYRDNFPAAPPAGLPPSALEMLQKHVVNGELLVPPGHIFAMGDNRENSSDSRFWGLVPRENIVGTPFLIYWSYDAPTEELNSPGFSVSHMLDVGLHFATKTRWQRTMNLVRPYPLPR
jgi:signal peptidase I